MPNRKKVFYALFLFAVVLALLPGCPKKTDTSITPEAQVEEGAAGPDRAGTINAEDAARAAEAEAEAREREAAEAAGLQPIYFDFDSAVIRADARGIMKANADWLKAHPGTRIRIEGNCDERGTREYNQALGQRRASNAKKYLTDLGVPGSRISLISYGKEKPVCDDSSEECWQNNRRDDFVAE